MLVSVFIRHYKAYKNINYVPVSDGANFICYLGENGVGKSSILEGLDKFFNGDTKEWDINKQAKSEGGLGKDKVPFIAPVFLIEKSKFANKKFRDNAEKLSSYFWNVNLQSSSSELSKFYEHREILKKKFGSEAYYLIIAGKKYNGKQDEIYFSSSFHKSIRAIFLHTESSESDKDEADEKDSKYEKQFQEQLEGFLDYLLGLYTYLYIPVETDLASYTRLETESMQKLMDLDIQKAIEHAITHKVVEDINSKLTGFVDEIHQTLADYKYKGTWKEKLTMADLVSKIIESYFSIKKLHKKKKNVDIPVDSLSSGEKRRALIDVAYSFLQRNVSRDKKVILAIDEPEASLHLSACYDQFDKLNRLSRLNHQVLLTTHWYGFLPSISEGQVHSLLTKENAVEIVSLDLYNYRERLKQERQKAKGKLPYDIYIKSYNDLVQAILSAIRKETPYNWLICEGLSEKIYFENYFKEEIAKKNLRILPMGGCDEVIKLYDYLHLPMNEKDLEIKGKIFCLIDTDSESKKLHNNHKLTNLEIRRLLNDDIGTTLAQVEQGKKSPPTEIEDCLQPDIYYETLLSMVDGDLVNILNSQKKVEKASNSATCLDLRQSEVEQLKAFFDRDDNKVKFAKAYVQKLEFLDQKSMPRWLREIKAFF